MDLCTGLGDGHDLGCIARDVTRHIGKHGEACHHLEFVFGGGLEGSGA